MTINQKYRTIIFYKDYFQEFFLKQRDKVKEIKKALKIKEEYEKEKK